MSETEAAAPDNSIAWLEKTALENAQRTKSGAAKTGALRLLAELKGVLKPTNAKPVADTKPAEELSETEAAREIAFLLARGVKLLGFPIFATGTEHKELPKPEPAPKKTIEEIRTEVEASLKEQDGLDQWERIELERCKARELKRPDQRQTFANVGHANAKPRRQSNA